ncbi:response regulator [Methyloceanibacter sp.]|uniref:response regulator n=1 Tax=Methyloceanibacter sp. TaxID=1965321 RepID=UPI002D2B8EE3|nr:response regulator [Methyloceanibacter sp.]HZP08597.1 response regulator [Methyloceanibacter sp.]
MPRILVLDDEPLISMLVEDWLTDLGCEVVGPVRSVAEGLRFAGEMPLDGAILDVHLAGQNSFSVATELEKRGIPFAFATGDAGVAPEAGFKDPILLPKPFNFNGVKAVLDRMLAARQRGNA